MKRLSILILIALLAAIISGCRFVLIESDTILVSGSAALAESEGENLFIIDEIDTSFMDEEPLVDMTPKPTKTPKPTATPKPTKEPPRDENGEVLIGLHSRDEEGETGVRKLQTRLNELGYLDQEPDGDFGSRTLKALKRFQKDQKLKQSGVLDAATSEALFPAPKVTTAPEDVLYEEGASGDEIVMMQERLQQYGFYTRKASGEYDEYTADRVRDFQEYAVEHYGTEFDDPVELLVEPMLLDNYVPMPDVTPQPVVDQSQDHTIPDMPALEPEATLRPHHALDGIVSENLYQYLRDDRFPVYQSTVQMGDSGIEVERLQCRLTCLDYYYEDITGEFNDATVQALKTFQKRNELQQTGIADIETQQRLFSAGATEGERVDQPFYIKVSIDEQKVYVYRWSDGGYNQLIKTMICSTGFGSSTPKGVFVSPGQRDARWHYFAEFKCWAQYAFIIRGSILFHSVIYSRRDENSLRRSTLAHLGHKASHGCVRLKVEDAKWIYEHCGKGQVIEVY